METKYKNKYIMPYDNKGNERTEKEWFNRYLVKASERDDMFEAKPNNKK